MEKLTSALDFLNVDKRIKSLEQWQTKAVNEIKELFKESQENYQKAQESQATAEDALQNSINTFKKAESAFQNAQTALENAQTAYNLAQTLNTKAENAYTQAITAYNNTTKTIQAMNQTWINLKNEITTMYNTLNRDIRNMQSIVNTVASRIASTANAVSSMTSGANTAYSGVNNLANNIYYTAEFLKQLKPFSAGEQLAQAPNNFRVARDGFGTMAGGANSMKSNFDALTQDINNLRAALASMTNNLIISLDRVKASLLEVK